MRDISVFFIFVLLRILLNVFWQIAPSGSQNGRHTNANLIEHDHLQLLSLASVYILLPGCL